jgi:hypothetical protein
MTIPSWIDSAAKVVFWLLSNATVLAAWKWLRSWLLILWIKEISWSRQVVDGLRFQLVNHSTFDVHLESILIEPQGRTGRMAVWIGVTPYVSPQPLKIAKDGGHLDLFIRGDGIQQSGGPPFAEIENVRVRLITDKRKEVTSRYCSRPKVR